MTEPVEVKPRFATPPMSEPQARPYTRPEFQSKGGFMNFVSQNKFTILVIVLMIIIILVLLYFFVWSKRNGEEKIDRGGGNESYDGRNVGGYQQLQTRLPQPMPGQPGGQPGHQSSQHGHPGHQPGQPSQSDQNGRPESQSSPEKRPSLTREELIEKLARANKNLTKTEQTAQESSEVEQEYELREQDDRDDEYIID